MSRKTFRLNALVGGVVFLCALVGGCDSWSSAKDGDKAATVPMKIGEKTFRLEVADTDALRQKGLMRRDSMPKDHGMIFVFTDEAPRGFWMKNTRIALDIVYVDAKGKVVSIKQMKPFDVTTVPSDGPAQYAIELNQGTAADVGIKAGDALELPKGLKARD
jgi:uncharacterized membrane protein (UPF0127 family)